MGKVPIYVANKDSSLQMLRRDIIANIHDFFADFRNFPQTNSLYNDEDEEVVFLAEGNVLVYVKFVDTAKDPTIDYILEDYDRVKIRWHRFCAKHAERGDVTHDEQYRLVLVSHRFSESLIRKIGFISDGNVCMCEIRMITKPTGEYSYVCEEITKRENRCATEVVMRSVDVTGKDDANDELQDIATVTQQSAPVPCVEAETSQDASGARVAGKSRKKYPDFFERAQLTTEEERAFFLLNKQLADHLD